MILVAESKTLAPTELTCESKAANPARAQKQVVKAHLKHILAITALAAALTCSSIYGFSYWSWSQHHESTDNAFIDAHIVQVSPRVTGHVAKVFVEDNQFI